MPFNEPKYLYFISLKSESHNEEIGYLDVQMLVRHMTLNPIKSFNYIIKRINNNDMILYSKDIIVYSEDLICKFNSDKETYGSIPLSALDIHIIRMFNKNVA